MINAIFTILLILLFFATGSIIPSLKKFFQLITKWLLNFIYKIVNLFKRNSQTYIVSKETRKVFKGIKNMKKSKNNIKNKLSIDVIFATIFIVGVLLIILNLQSVSNNMISNMLFNTGILFFVKTSADMGTLFTATMFSVISFSFGKILQRWKETKHVRVERKNEKIKKKAMDLLSESELLNKAKKNSETKLKEFIHD